MTKLQPHTDECLPKAYKLCSLKKIEELYKTGALIKAYPLRVMYFTEAIDPAAEPTEAFQVLFSAPKRRFKRAHDRNYIKRLMREVLRKNKMPLLAALHQNNKKMVFSLTFVSDERPSYQLLEQKLCKALDQLIKEINP
ncbi:MAG: ribonuclease P protein component [Crocinitomicaceae bacterium]|nr:ribonuclease P protein component [Crocinitomicaceae bacterium]